jgi:putative addiction module killer protein
MGYNNIYMKQIKYYETISGERPFEKWFLKLDNSIKKQISKRFVRIIDGNYGDFKWIDDDISELRFTIGKGYRIYYSDIDDVVILFLCGGDKSDQSSDIKKAKEYLKDHIERFKNE